MAEINVARNSGNRNITYKKNTKQKNYFYIDYSLFFMMVFIVCFGLVILYSASSYECQMEYGNPSYYLDKQFKAVLAGFVMIAVIVFLTGYKFFRRPIIAYLIYFGAMALTFLVLTPLGVSANGAKRWINVGMSVQVCEVVKIAVIIFMAFYLNRYGKNIKNFKEFVKAFAVVLLPTGLIAGITKDLSSAVVIVGIGCIMLLVVCPNIKYLLWVIGVVAAGGSVFILTASFRMERIKVWLHPEKYQDEGGFQVLQALYSIGSGGLFGKGLGKGVQKLGYVPEAQNDMIFTVICEELGIVGGIAVILMFVFIIYRLWTIAVNASDLFGSLLVIGVMAHISVQAIINLAVVTNLFPNTGVPLPFLSYGGTSIMGLLVEMGLVFAVSRRKRAVKYPERIG